MLTILYRANILEPTFFAAVLLTICLEDVFTLDDSPLTFAAADLLTGNDIFSLINEFLLDCCNIADVVAEKVVVVCGVDVVAVCGAVVVVVCGVDVVSVCGNVVVAVCGADVVDADDNNVVVLENILFLFGYVSVVVNAFAV